MELRKRLDFRIVVMGIFAFVFMVYLIIGLQPADAANYEISAELSIPSIGLESDVTTLTLKDKVLETPDYIVGSFSRAKNKTLLIGHSSTVFQDLGEVKIGDAIEYDETGYRVVETKVFEKAEISMEEILAAEDTDTLVIMTCAGEDLGDGDATHRLIIVASA